MAKSSKKAAAKKTSRSVLVSTEATPRYVTPSDPLVINEVAPTYDNVIIQGGQIIARVQTNATFNRLEKQN